MEVSKEKQYEFITGHLQYVNEKIYQSFTLFLKLASAIVGGVFLLHWKLSPEDAKRASFECATDWLFILVTFSMIFLILNNLRSWFGYRKALSELCPTIPFEKNAWRCGTEVVMCLVIVIACIGFLLYNPL
jgi:hypothetical protein